MRRENLRIERTNLLTPRDNICKEYREESNTKRRKKLTRLRRRNRES